MWPHSLVIGVNGVSVVIGTDDTGVVDFLSTWRVDEERSLVDFGVRTSPVEPEVRSAPRELPQLKHGSDVIARTAVGWRRLSHHPPRGRRRAGSSAPPGWMVAQPSRADRCDNARRGRRASTRQPRPYGPCRCFAGNGACARCSARRSATSALCGVRSSVTRKRAHRPVRAVSRVLIS